MNSFLSSWKQRGDLTKKKKKAQVLGKLYIAIYIAINRKKRKEEERKIFGAWLHTHLLEMKANLLIPYVFALRCHQKEKAIINVL